MDSLTDHDTAILALERQFWRSLGTKEDAIRDQLGMTPVRYCQRLNQLVASEAALAFDPVTVNRLRRIRRRKSTRRSD